MFHRKTGISIVAFLSLFMYKAITAETFLVFGGKRGWIGQKIVNILKKRGYTVYCAKARLEQRKQIEEEINVVKPDYIINSAGIIGKPTVNWCETHKRETIRSNVLGLVNLIDIAFLNNIHVTNISTGCIYQYDEKHPLGSGIGFSEEDDPNFTDSFYSYTKVLQKN